MSLRVNNLSSFGGNAPMDLIVNITGSTNDFVLKNHAAVSPYFAQPGRGRDVLVFLTSGVIVGSTSTSTAAFSTGSGWGSGWGSVQIIVASGSARIQGKGGAGGVGFQRGTLVESVCEAGGLRGGGGGGAGTQVGAGANASGSSGTATAGGSGGTANPAGNCNFALDGNGLPGGVALEATSGGPNVQLRPAAGQTLEVWGGGGGGGGSSSGATAGGAGGGPGLDGAAAASGSAGGAHGKAYSTPGAATITEIGPGTVDDRGS